MLFSSFAEGRPFRASVSDLVGSPWQVMRQKPAVLPAAAQLQYFGMKTSILNNCMTLGKFLQKLGFRNGTQDWRSIAEDHGLLPIQAHFRLISSHPGLSLALAASSASHPQHCQAQTGAEECWEELRRGPQRQSCFSSRMAARMGDDDWSWLMVQGWWRMVTE